MTKKPTPIPAVAATTDERVRELAARGMTGAAIARELGVSRQRIHQIADRAGIALARGIAAAQPPAQPAAPTAALCAPTTFASPAADLLVEADLTIRGWRVYAPVVAKGAGPDLLALRGDETMRLEVRAGRRAKGGAVDLARRDGCRLALVLPGEPVLYYPPLPVLYHPPA